MIYKSSGGVSAVQPKDFNLELEKKCDEPIKIGAVFLTSYVRNSNTILPKADSQFGIQIRDSNKNLVPINEPFPLMSFGAGQSPNAFVPFTASLISFGNPEVGPFEAIMVVQGVYY